MKKILPKNNVSIWEKAAETLPNDEWECEICHGINTNWMVNFDMVINKHKIEFRHGLCDNCRMIADEEIKKQDLATKKKNDKLRIMALLKASQIPPKVSETTFNDLEIRQGAELAFKTMKRISKADRWVYISGTNNTGKTLLVGATINDLVTKNISCYYFNERALFKRLKDSMNRQNAESSYSIMKRLRDADIIFWDDFSVLPYTDWEIGTAYDILEFCDTYYKKVIFFSNIDLKSDLKANEEKTKNRIGRRVLARMKKNDIYYITMKNIPFM